MKALEYLTYQDGGDMAVAVHDAADNMTERLGALACLIRTGRADAALSDFFDRWQHDPNTLNKWFSMQVVHSAPERAVDVANRLTGLPEFDLKNPNRTRAVLGGLIGNFAGFHHASGAGYGFLSDWLQRLDALNPQTAARLAKAFETIRLFDGDRQSLMRDALERLRMSPSRDMAEITSRVLDT